MAIGDTVRAELMRVDPSAILEVGRVRGQLGQQVGQTLGGLATTYFDTKKRNKELEGERKGITDALKMVGKFRPDMSDDINAQIQFLEDPENPLSQRVAGGIRFLQNIDMAEKLRSASQLEAQRKRELDMQEELTTLRGDAMLIDNLRNKLALGQAIEEEDLYPVSERVGRKKELDVAKISGARASAELTEQQARKIEQDIQLTEENKYLNKDEKTARINLLKEELKGKQSEREKSERAMDALTDASIMQPDEKNEIFKEFATLDLPTAFQGDIKGYGLKAYSTIAEKFGGGATETIEQAQKLASLNLLLKPALAAQLSGKPSNYTLEWINQNLPQDTDGNKSGTEKIKKLIPILNERLKEAVNTVRMGKQTATYYQEALTQARMLPNIIGGLEVALENYLGAEEAPQPTRRTRKTTGRATTGVGYKILTD
jgi:hypothetical protein